MVVICFFVQIVSFVRRAHTYLPSQPPTPTPKQQDKYATTAATTNGRGLAWRAGGLVPREALAECMERHLSLRCVPLSQGGGRVSPVMILSSSSAPTPTPSRLLALQGCGQALAAAGVGAKRQQRQQQEEEGWAAMCEVSP